MTLASALRRHQGGDLPGAEALYRRVLESDPRNAEALHLLGVLRFQCGDKDAGVKLVATAIEYGPEAAQYRLNLAAMLVDVRRFDEALAALGDLPQAQLQRGNVLVKLKRYHEAAAAYREAVRLEPRSADAHNNLANALLRLERPQEAESACRRALAIAPGHGDAHLTLGNILVRRGARELARAEFEQAIRSNPASARAWCNLGNLLREDGRLDDAERALRRALELDAALSEARLNLGALLEASERIDEAEQCYREALRLNPAEARVWTNLGNIHKRRGDYDEALRCAGRAVELEPGLAAAHNNRGAILERLVRRSEAIAEYETAIRLDPGFAQAHFNRGLWLLQSGRFDEGWKEYEWRLRDPETSRPVIPCPVWDGSPLAGRTILLHTEQGLGDAIQFVRYVPLVLQRGGRVILHCAERLRPLFERLPGVERIVTPGSALAGIDCHAPLMSLPRILGTTLTGIPGEVPYLSASAEAAERWRRRLAAYQGRKVGLVWAGNKRPKANPHRSLQIEQLEPLLSVAGVHWFGLQRGADAAELTRAAFAGSITNLEDDESYTIEDTAAAILNLDLLITVDTITAHLAGALARPVWILLEAACDWRWLLERSDSPWYPTARVFRQPRPGDWASAVRAVREELE